MDLNPPPPPTRRESPAPDPPLATMPLPHDHDRAATALNEPPPPPVPARDPGPSVSMPSPRHPSVQRASPLSFYDSGEGVPYARSSRDGPHETNTGSGRSHIAMQNVYQPLPARPMPTRILTGDTNHGNGNGRQMSEVDWIIPVTEKSMRPKSIGERLQPTLSTAEAEKTKYALKAKMTGYALNIAIGLQVLLGALTTGISAATTGKSTSIGICILGGVSTMVASYLARARGSNEPELSITRVKDLEQFIRECQAFQMDHGHCTGNEFDGQLDSFRKRFEELLGNANGERKLSTPV